MEWNPQTLQFLSQSFLDTLSPHPELRRRAEKNLSDAADTPNYGLSVLRLIAEPSVDEQIRQCAALNFKNHIKTRWMRMPSSSTPIPDGEKQQIKTLIVPIIHSATPKIQALLIEALAAIGNHDFPNLWPALLPDLISRLETGIIANDFASVNCVLAIVNALFNKFRCQINKRNPIVLLDLKYCVDNFGAQLLITVESISRKINSAAGSYSVVATLGQLLEAQRLCCRIFYSLNFLDVPEDIYNAADDDQWMNAFKNCLTIEDGRDADCLSLLLVDEEAAVCENINYMEKEEELLQKHLNDFLKVVGSLLVAASVSPSRERLTATAIKFLTIVSTSVHHELFAGDDDKLDKMIQGLVIPNVMLRDEDEELVKKNYFEFIVKWDDEEDEELLEKNYVEFIRSDMEWSDLDTRRKVACELLRGIAGKNKENMIIAYIHRCLALFAENPAANWKYKECAIYLVVSTLDTKKATCLVSTDLVVDVESFFESVIVPELQGKDVNAFPMLKAGALKFFTMFCFFIPKHVAIALLGDVARFLDSNFFALHSYAATCIEKVLLVKDSNGVARYTASDINPIHGVFMGGLFYALHKLSSLLLVQNQYIMRCIMRVLQISDISPEMAPTCIYELTKVLNQLRGYPNPKKKNPVFSHFLFEAVAVYVRRACEKNPSLVPVFQTRLVRELLMISNPENSEFAHYAFQLLAQLVDLIRPPIHPHYMEVFDSMLAGFDLWGNKSAPILLLQSFLRQAHNEVNREGRLTNVLGIFNKLVSSPTTEEQGFNILYTVIDTYGYNVIAEYMNDIWALLFTRLQNSKTPTFVRCLIKFMCLFLVKHGVQTLVDLINSVQADLFHDILSEFWIPNLKTISGGYNYAEVKLCAVASTKLLCESASLLDPAAEELWGKLLDAIVTLLSLPVQEERVEDDDELQVPDLTGYQGSKFVRLQNVGRKKEDPLKEINDPKQFLVAFPENLSSQFHGKFPLVTMRYLSPANQATLVGLCNSYNIAIV